VPNVLFSALLEWIAPGEREIEIVDESESDAVEIKLPNKITGCDLSRALLNVNGNRQLLFKLLKDVVEDHANDLAVIRQAVATGDQAGAVRIAHSLKTVFGTLGGTQLNQQFAVIERELKDQLPESADGLLAGVAQPFEQIMAELMAWAPKESTTSIDLETLVDVPKLTEHAFAERVDALRDALSSFSADAANLARDLAPHVEDPSVARRLVEQTELFEFDQALDLLSQVKRR